MKKKILLLGLISGLVLTGCGEVNNEFKNALNEYTNSEENEYGYEVKVENNTMTVKHNEQNYTIMYDLSDNPTFIYEVEVKKGIDYEEYISKTDGFTLPKVGYIALANTYGVDFEDSSVYFDNLYLDGMFSSISEGAETYIVVDNAEDYEGEGTVILTKDFGDKVVEFVESSYKNDVSFKDEDNNTFSYNLSAECEKDSCTMTSKLTVNKEGNFSELKGYSLELAKENMDESITPKSADYHIELSVGDVITIKGKELSGYEIAGIDVVEVESLDSEYIFSSVKEGVANGVFYVGEEDTRTFYLTVSKSTDNDNENKTLTIK